ncbi:MAG: hypothetical protein R2715_13370 [Ilumatobacteraceae bacterium]
MEFHTIIEPFRIHSVEPLAMTTEEAASLGASKPANLFALRAEDVCGPAD